MTLLGFRRNVDNVEASISKLRRYPSFVDFVSFAIFYGSSTFHGGSFTPNNLIRIFEALFLQIILEKSVIDDRFVQFRLNAIRDDGIYIIAKIIELVNMLKLVRLVCNEYNILYIDCKG